MCSMLMSVCEGLPGASSCECAADIAYKYKHKNKCLPNVNKLTSKWTAARMFAAHKAGCMGRRDIDFWQIGSCKVTCIAAATSFKLSSPEPSVSTK